MINDKKLSKKEVYIEANISHSSFYAALETERLFSYDEIRRMFSVLTEAGPPGNGDRAVLRQAFLKDALGEWAQEPEQIAPRLTLGTLFVRDLLQVPTPSAPEGRTVARLLGGAVFAIKMLEVLTAHPEYGSAP